MQLQYERRLFESDQARLRLWRNQRHGRVCLRLRNVTGRLLRGRMPRKLQPMRVIVVCMLLSACKNTTPIAPKSQCSDASKNGAETDVDCGGAHCSRCAAGKHCAYGHDCQSSVCDQGVCSQQACDDGIRNGDETDVDCGGHCPHCPIGDGCQTPSDCLSKVCSDNVCVVATCTDGKTDGDETDIDCGGSCAPCATGRDCATPADCSSQLCVAALCVAPSCTDGVKNGTESDIDCGGGCGIKCTLGQGCGSGGDCQGGLCTQGACAACALDSDCGSNTECQTFACTSGACVTTNLPASTSLTQAAGDCATRACDAKGHVTLTLAASDLVTYPSADDCVSAVCSAPLDLTYQASPGPPPSHPAPLGGCDMEPATCSALVANRTLAVVPGGESCAIYGLQQSECAGDSCVGCSPGGPCFFPSECKNGACEGCAGCSTGACVVNPGQNFCGPCDENNRCLSGQFCDASLHTCIDCKGANQCQDLGTGRCFTVDGSDPTHCGNNGGACSNCASSLYGFACTKPAGGGYQCGCAADTDCLNAPAGAHCVAPVCSCSGFFDCLFASMGPECITGGSTHCGCSTIGECYNGGTCNGTDNACE